MRTHHSNYAWNLQTTDPKNIRFGDALTLPEFDCYLRIVEHADCNAALAERYGASEESVKRLVFQTMKKMGCQSRLQLLVRYHRRERKPVEEFIP